MRSVLADTVQDGVALISGLLAERGGPEPALEQQLQDIIADLETADPVDVVTVFAGVATSLVRELGRATLTEPSDLWQDIATRITERLTREAPDTTDGGHHG